MCLSLLSSIPSYDGACAFKILFLLSIYFLWTSCIFFKLYLPHPPSPSRSCSLHTHPSSFSFPLFKTKIKIKHTNKQTKDTVHGQLLLSTEPALECGWYTQGLLIKEKGFFFSQGLSFMNSLLIRGGNFMSTSPLLCWAFVWLELIMGSVS